MINIFKIKIFNRRTFYRYPHQVVKMSSFDFVLKTLSQSAEEAAKVMYISANNPKCENVLSWLLLEYTYLLDYNRSP